MAITKNTKAGTAVRINSGFFEGREGKVHEEQGKPTDSGIWILIAATDTGTPRRLWFPLGELDLAPKKTKVKAS
jgi:hypothetical protein